MSLTFAVLVTKKSISVNSDYLIMCYIRVSLDQGADIQVQHVLIAGKDFREKRQSVKGRVKVRHVPGDFVEESLQLRSLTLYLL